MFAVIRAGGKQYKVAEGDVIEIERVRDATEPVEFVPLLVVDDSGASHVDPSKLARARVKATIVGETAGPKIDIVKFKNKSRYRRHTGHRQKYTAVRIAGIELASGAGSR